MDDGNTHLLSHLLGSRRGWFARVERPWASSRPPGCPGFDEAGSRSVRRPPDRPVTGPSGVKLLSSHGRLAAPPCRTLTHGQTPGKAATAPGGSRVTRARAGPAYPHRRFITRCHTRHGGAARSGTHCHPRRGLASCGPGSGSSPSGTPRRVSCWSTCGRRCCSRMRRC